MSDGSGPERRPPPGSHDPASGGLPEDPRAELDLALGRGPERRASAGSPDLAGGGLAQDLRAEFDRGLRLSTAGDHQGAAEAFRRVTEAAPGLHQAHFNLGRALERAGHLDQAADAYLRALALRPDHLKALRALADLRQGAGRTAEAVPLYERALALAPGDAGLLNNLGLALGAAGRPQASLEALERAAALAPDSAPVHRNLGNAVRLLRGAEAAVPHYRRALACDPGYAAAWEALGGVFHRSDPDQAAACYAEALARDPDNVSALHGRLALAQRRCDFEAAEASHRRLSAVLASAAGVPGDWRLCANLLYSALYRPFPEGVAERLQDRVAERLSAEVAASGPLPPPRPPARADGRIRLGYLSPHFGDHPVGHVTLGLFAAHDRGRFEVHGLSTRAGGPDGSAYARLHAARFDAFHDLGGRPPREAAEHIRALGIDVLVDLDGWLDATSPPILAYRPAPVQVFWLGHPGGLGLPFVDCLLADAVVVPPGEECRYREAVVRLPVSYHCADRHPVAPAAGSRADWGLPAEGVVYGAFNNPDKIDRAVFEAWMRVLAAVEGSVLWLSPFRQAREALGASLRGRASRWGVAPERLVLAERVPDKAVHLARLGHADLMLDTLTINASTTALDALGAGVPLLAVRGDRFGNRISTSMLQALGLGDLVCADLAEYERRAVALGRDPAGRETLRARVRAGREGSPLFDAARFARHLEEAFAGMVGR